VRVISCSSFKYLTLRDDLDIGARTDNVHNGTSLASIWIDIPAGAPSIVTNLSQPSDEASID
jgi:hypothetical protein